MSGHPWWIFSTQLQVELSLSFRTHAATWCELSDFITCSILYCGVCLQKLLGVSDAAASPVHPPQHQHGQGEDEEDEEEQLTQQQEPSQQQQYRPKPSRPLQPQNFQQKMGFNGVTSGSSSSSSLGGADVSSAAAACEALEGAQLAYWFVPLKQQQGAVGSTQGNISSGVGGGDCSGSPAGGNGQPQVVGTAKPACLDWQAVHHMLRGLQHVTEVLSGDDSPPADSAAACGQVEAGGAAAIAAQHARPAAAAVVAVPDAMTAQQAAAAEKLLAGRVLLAGHSSKLYRITSVDQHMTLATPLEITWADSSQVGSFHGGTGSASGASGTARNHQEYYSRRYVVGPLRPDLPVLAVSGGRGRASVLPGWIENPLKPPAMQCPHRSAAATPGDGNASGAQHPLERGSEGQLTLGGPGSTMPGSAAGSTVPPAIGSVAAADGDEPARLPLELCWLLPLDAEAWRQVQLMPALMYRINSLLRLRSATARLRSLPHAKQHFALSSNGGVQGQQAVMQGDGQGQMQGQQQARGQGQGQQQARGQGQAAAAEMVARSFILPPPDALMVALTGARAGEASDQEGLEFLGDVVLKYLATAYCLQVRVGRQYGWW